MRPKSLFLKANTGRLGLELLSDLISSFLVAHLLRLSRSEKQESQAGNRTLGICTLLPEFWESVSGKKQKMESVHYCQYFGSLYTNACQKASLYTIARIYGKQLCMYRFREHWGLCSWDFGQGFRGGVPYYTVSRASKVTPHPKSLTKISAAEPSVFSESVQSRFP